MIDGINGDFPEESEIFGKLREVANKVIPEEEKQTASEYFPDDEIHLESVIESFFDLQKGILFSPEIKDLHFDDRASSGNERLLNETPAAQREIFEVATIRRDFPILQRKVNGRPLVWFDNGATTQKPLSVINRLVDYYSNYNSNVHRGAHTLAAHATDGYEGTREKVRDFIHALAKDEIIYVRGTTEGINLIANTYGEKYVGEGDEIIVSTLDHHANIVPWQQLAKRKKAKFYAVPIDAKGDIILEEYEKLLSPRTKVVSIGQVNNTFGTILPVKTMIEMAKRYNACVLIDGAQSIAHIPVDVQDLNCDFFVFSGHKIYGPTGIGIVYGKKELLEVLPPWQGGGNMIKDVTIENTVFNDPPARFEAGTPNIADAIALGDALDYVKKIGLSQIAAYEHELTEYGRKRLGEVKGLTIVGDPVKKSGVISFVIEGIPTLEIGPLLDKEGIAIRAGHHCAQPSLRSLGYEATARATFAFYNTKEEIDRLVEAIYKIKANYLFK